MCVGTCIDTPYFIAEIDAWCLKNHLYDLIIGNIPKARERRDPDMNWTPNIANKPICVQYIINSSVRPDELRAAQEGVLLVTQKKYWFGWTGNKRRRKDSFFQKKGMIYRTFQSSSLKNGKTITQLHQRSLDKRFYFLLNNLRCHDI